MGNEERKQRERERQQIEKVKRERERMEKVEKKKEWGAKVERKTQSRLRKQREKVWCESGERKQREWREKECGGCIEKLEKMWKAQVKRNWREKI